MSWFGNQPMKPPAPLPPSDAPEATPIPASKLSPERAAAITKLIASGYERDGVHRPVRDTRHALFLCSAGILELPA